MKLIPKILIFLFVIVFSPLLFAEEAEKIDENDIIERVLNIAPDTLKAKEELGEAESNYLSSKSAFDTDLSAKVDYSRDEFQRTSDFFGTRTDTAHWNIGISKKLPTGTETSLNWTNERIELFGLPTFSGQRIFPAEPTYESIVEISVSQPLMKNLFGINDRSSVSKAKKLLESSGLNTKYKISSVGHKALSLYWQWVLAYGYLKYRYQSVADAQDFFNITLDRRRLGTVEDTDVLAARANLIRKRNGLITAKKILIDVENKLKILLDYDPEKNIKPEDNTPRYLDGFHGDPAEAINYALANRWDYLAKKKELKRQKINLISMKNKRWPELNLVGTLAVNGLTTSYSDTLHGVDNPYWSIGMQFSIPLENRMARAEYKSAKHRKRIAIINLKKKENEISNQIYDFIRKLRYDKEILQNAIRAEKIQRDKLIKETSKYRIGRSNSEMIVLYQDDKIKSEIETLDAWGNYIQTVLNLKLAENILMDVELKNR